MKFTSALFRSGLLSLRDVQTGDEDARRVNPSTGRDGEEQGGKGGGISATSPPTEEAFDVTLVSQVKVPRMFLLHVGGRFWRTLCTQAR